MACVVLFVCAVLYPLVFEREALYWGDLMLYFNPLQRIVQESLREGRLPLWNPYVLCGQPLVGNPQTWLFYPTSVLLVFMSVWAYIAVNTVLHVMLAGLGAYLYLRRISGDRTGAVLGAITYSGSGFLIARLQFPPMVQAAAYLPWLLLLIDRMVDRPRPWYGPLLGGVVALSVLAAHTQITYMSFATAAAYAVARLYHRRRRPSAQWSFVRLSSALVVGIVTAAVQLLPAVQLFRLSTRGKLTWMQANRFVLMPEQLLNFLFPYFFGSPTRANYWGSANLWEPCVYVGVLPLCLALYAVIYGSRRPAVRFFAVTAFVSIWLALGRFGGLFWFAFYLVPGISSFHDPARFTFTATFAIATLSAVGIRRLRDRGVPQWALASGVFVAAINLLWFSARLNPTLQPSAFAYRPRILAETPPQGVGRVFTARRDQVWDRYVNYADYGPDSSRYAHELTDTFAPNIGMRYRVEEGSGYEPVPIRTVTEVDGLVRVALGNQSPHLHALLGLFNAHLLLLPEAMRYPHPALIAEEERGVSAYTVRDPYPRAWLVRQTVRVDGSARTLATLASPEFDPSRIAVVSGSDGLGGVAGDAPVQRVLSKTARDGSFEAVVDAGPAAAFLVWSAARYPGWTAVVDGRPARLERANHAFTGLVVPAGRHQVAIRYRPFAFQFALYVSLVGVSTLTAGMAGGLVLRRTSRRFRA